MMTAKLDDDDEDDDEDDEGASSAAFTRTGADASIVAFAQGEAAPPLPAADGAAARNELGTAAVLLERPEFFAAAVASAAAGAGLPLGARSTNRWRSAAAAAAEEEG